MSRRSTSLLSCYLWLCNVTICNAWLDIHWQISGNQIGCGYHPSFNDRRKRRCGRVPTRLAGGKQSARLGWLLSDRVACQRDLVFTSFWIKTDKSKWRTTSNNMCCYVLSCWIDKKTHSWCNHDRVCCDLMLRSKAPFQDQVGENPFYGGWCHV